MPFPGCLHLSLVVELHSKLDLARILSGEAGRSNFTEGRAVEVVGTRDRGNTIAAEVGSIEGRVIEDVKELSPELHIKAFVDGNILERREVEFSDSRTLRGGGITAEN